MSEGMGYGKKKLIQNIIQSNWGDISTEDRMYTFNDMLFIIQELTTEEGKAYQEQASHASINQGFQVYRSFVEHLMYRNIANYDSMILLTSDKGTGKSSAAIMLARWWCKIIGIKFDPNRHIAYNNADVMNKIDALNKFEPIIADEAVRFASSEDWAKKENKELKKRLAQVRTKHLFFILCFPLKIYKLEKTYLESYVNYWCLPGDTKIITKDINGAIRQTPIKDLNKRNPEVLTYNIQKKEYEFKTYDKKIKTKKNTEVYEVELENGIKIKATEEHLFLTTNGYKKLKDLTEEDELIVRSKKCIECNKDFIPTTEQMKFCCTKCSDKNNGKQKKWVEYQKEYRLKNKLKVKEQQKSKYIKNKDKYLEDAKEYRIKNKEKINAWHKEYRENNRDLLRERYKTHWIKYKDIEQEKSKIRYKNNKRIRLQMILGTRLYELLKKYNKSKTQRTFKYLGCSVEFLIEHLEEQFQTGMTWDNQGQWHIDHIKPCCKFDLTKEEQIYECFNYNNLQPLWAKDNMIKGGKYDN